MTDKMKRFLTLATGPMGVTASMFDQYREASKNGWVSFSGVPQNSTTSRYKITEAGIAALQSI